MGAWQSKPSPERKKRVGIIGAGAAGKFSI
jgi:hypothetical protein